MTENNKIYITASELADMLGVSVGHAYKLIRKLNQELEKDGFLVIAGKSVNSNRNTFQKWIST